MTKKISEAEIEKIFKDAEEVKEIVVKAIKNGAKNPGTMPCPICRTGILKYKQDVGNIDIEKGHVPNGHVNARCSTKDCVCFME